MLECRQCSPEQIAHKLKLENPDDFPMHVSHETIYWAIYAHPRNALKKLFIMRTSFERQLAKIDSFMRLSMTYDRGSEIAQHTLMSAKLKMHIYFAEPHSPWQRSSNENINGLLRQYLPKGTDLSGVSQTRLNDIACLLNTRRSRK